MSRAVEEQVRSHLSRDASWPRIVMIVAGDIPMPMRATERVEALGGTKTRATFDHHGDVISARRDRDKERQLAR
jgi:hypothetical protein